MQCQLVNVPGAGEVQHILNLPTPSDPFHSLFLGSVIILFLRLLYSRRTSIATSIVLFHRIIPLGIIVCKYEVSRPSDISSWWFKKEWYYFLFPQLRAPVGSLKPKGANFTKRGETRFAAWSFPLMTRRQLCMLQISFTEIGQDGPLLQSRLASVYIFLPR